MKVHTSVPADARIAARSQIENFSPDPGAVKPTKCALRGLTHTEVAQALAQGHPKSAHVPLHKGTEEGPRTGVPHIQPHSTRFVESHESRGTHIERHDGP
jgi:hypothetical protein